MIFFSKFFFSVTVRRMKLKFGILALDIALYNSYDFYSGQIRTLTLKTWKRDLL